MYYSLRKEVGQKTDEVTAHCAVVALLVTLNVSLLSCLTVNIIIKIPLLRLFFPLMTVIKQRSQPQRQNWYFHPVILHFAPRIPRIQVFFMCGQCYGVDWKMTALYSLAFWILQMTKDWLVVTLFQDIFVHHDCFYNYLQCISNFFYVDSSSVHPSHANDDIYLHFMIFDLDVVSSWLCNKLASGLSSIEIVHCTELTRRPNHLAHFESW